MLIGRSINRINRQKDQANNEFFWFLTNKLGYNLEICHNYFINGEKRFTKWKSFLWLLEQEPDDYNEDLHMTRQQFIEKATHRSVLDIEIMIDIDEPDSFKTIKEKAEYICKKLKDHNIPFTSCFSGSKSYHISILIPGLRNLSNYDRDIKKSQIISSLFGSDGLKASSRNMIALEGVPHWKTGIIKKEVDYYG